MPQTRRFNKTGIIQMSAPARKLEPAKVHTSPSGRRYVSLDEIIQEELDEIDRHKAEIDKLAEDKAVKSQENGQPKTKTS